MSIPSAMVTTDAAYGDLGQRRIISHGSGAKVRMASNQWYGMPKLR
jgi:hypothetical protein